MWTLIEIKSQGNGAHRNQTTLYEPSRVPEGWAVVVCDTPNFPFGVPTVEMIDGVPTVTKWEPGERPEPETVPKPEKSPMEKENDLLKAQVAALSEQNDFQEELIVELANIVYA